MVDPEKLTIKAQKALGGAQSLAQKMKNQEIDVEHLLLALVEQGEGVVVPLLEKLGVPISRLEQELRSELQSRPRVEGGARQYISPRLDKLLNVALEIADGMRDEYISTEHLLLAALEVGGPGPEMIESFGVAVVVRAYGDMAGPEDLLVLQHPADDPGVLVEPDSELPQVVDVLEILGNELLRNHAVPGVLMRALTRRAQSRLKLAGFPSALYAGHQVVSYGGDDGLLDDYHAAL